MAPRPSASSSLFPRSIVNSTAFSRFSLGHQAILGLGERLHLAGLDRGDLDDVPAERRLYRCARLAPRQLEHTGRQLQGQLLALDGADRGRVLRRSGLGGDGVESGTLRQALPRPLRRGFVGEDQLAKAPPLRYRELADPLLVGCLQDSIVARSRPRSPRRPTVLRPIPSAIPER